MGCGGGYSSESSRERLAPCLLTGEEDCCGRMLSVQGQRRRIPSIADYYVCSTMATTMEMAEPPSRFHSWGCSYNLRERKGPLHAKCDWDWTISSTWWWSLGEVFILLGKQNESKQCDVTFFELQHCVSSIETIQAYGKSYKAGTKNDCI